MFIPFSVKANSIYNTIYDGFDYSSVISQHKTFSFTDKGGKKHTVFKATSSSAWICVFGERQVIGDDDELNYYLSWYSYTGYQSKLNVFFQFLAAQMGIITKGASTILEDAINNSSSVDVDYDDTNGLTISSDSVDKLREEIKKQYYTLIGLKTYPSVGNSYVKDYVSSSNFRNMFEYEEDYTDAYSRFIDYDYCITDRYSHFAFFFNKSDIDDYFYVSNSDADRHLFGGDSLWNEYKICKYNNNSVTALNMNFASAVYAIGYENDASKTFLYSNFSMFSIFNDEHRNGHGYSSTYVYKKQGLKDFEFFKSYEALYNYVQGSQNAYLSSKVEQTGEDIKISIDDMNTNISDKMDELIDSINNKKDGMSADELQNAIDKGLENISGKIDDTNNKIDDTNNKLDDVNNTLNDLSDIMSNKLESINDTLLQILGVTQYIAYNTTKSDGSDYTISDIKPHFDKCFTAVKNMLLFGKASLDDDVSVQAFLSSDYSVSTFSSNSIYAMSEAGLLCTLGGRTFYKVNDGLAYVAIFRNPNGYCGPILVSDVADNVAYTTCGKNFSYNYTVEYLNKTWYISNDEYFMGVSSSSSGFAQILSDVRTKPEDAALLLLKTADVSTVEPAEPDYPENVVKDYHNGILGKFPFSVPYQLYEWLQVLQCEPKTPQFSYDYGFLLKYFNMGSDIDTIITFDLSQYDDWAKTSRSFLKLSFVLAVAVGTYHKFKGEV